MSLVNQLRFDGEPVLVTAAGAGIGYACCEELGELGATVIVAESNRDRLDGITKLLRSKGVTCDAHQVDVSKEEDVLELHRVVSARRGHLKALLNIAGVNFGASITELSTNKWNEIVAINLTSMFYMCRAFIPMLKKSPSSAAIVNMASSLGLMALPKMPVYCATKGGVIALTRQLALDYGPDGIRVNCVCPGPTETPRLEQAFANGGLQRDSLENGVILGRMAKAAEVANAIVFLASDAASYIHGTALSIDGGQTAM
jgi:NAD(P)-dependent dehydrogenase (short-subunit alcohol dehydrogenase family)